MDDLILPDRITLLNVRLLQIEKKITSAVQRRLNRMSTEFERLVAGYALQDHQTLPETIVSLIRPEVDRLVKDVSEATTDVAVKFSDAINKSVIGGPSSERLEFSLTTFVDLQDEERIDDTFFQMVGESFGISEDEARELMSTLMLWGLRLDQLWANWRDRYLLDMRATIASRLGELRSVSFDGSVVDGAPQRRVRSSISNAIDNASTRAVKPAVGLISSSLFGAAQQLMALAVGKNPNAGVKVVWSSLLDARTCARCSRLHGKAFSVNEGVLNINPPPLHAFCRCFLLVYVNGQIVGSFDEWFKRQSVKVQKSIVGTRAVGERINESFVSSDVSFEVAI